MEGKNDVMKVIVPANISLPQMQEKACEKFDLVLQDRKQFVLHYMDTDFNDCINVTDVSDVADFTWLRLCKNMSDGDAGVASTRGPVSCETYRNFRQTAWPEEFQIPAFDVDVQLYLKEAGNSFSTSGKLAIITRDIKGKMFDSIASKIYSYTAYASAEQINTHTHTHNTQPFYCSSEVCPGPPG